MNSSNLSALDRLQSLTLRHHLKQSSEKIPFTQKKFSEFKEKYETDYPKLTKELKTIEEEEVKLKDLIKKAAEIRHELSQQDAADMEVAIGNARLELSTRRQKAEFGLHSLTKEYQRFENEIKNLVLVYDESVRQLSARQDHTDIINPEDFENAKNLIAFFEEKSPWGRARLLEKEIDAAEFCYGNLNQRQQYAQLKIWLGTFRQLQDEFAAMNKNEIIPANLAKFDPLFGRLVGISKTYKPGYIEEFQKGIKVDWDSYLERAKEEFKRASSL